MSHSSTKQITREELALQCGMAPRHITRLAKEGKIPGLKPRIAGQYEKYFPVESNNDLDTWIAHMAVKKNDLAARRKTRDILVAMANAEEFTSLLHGSQVYNSPLRNYGFHQWNDTKKESVRKAYIDELSLIRIHLNAYIQESGTTGTTLPWILTQCDKCLTMLGFNGSWDQLPPIKTLFSSEVMKCLEQRIPYSWTI